MNAGEASVGEKPRLPVNFAARVLLEAAAVRERRRRRRRNLGATTVVAGLAIAATAGLLRLSPAPRPASNVWDSDNSANLAVGWPAAADRAALSNPLAYLFPEASSLQHFVHQYSAAREDGGDALSVYDVDGFADSL